MNHIEFSVSRLRQIWDMDRDEPEFLAEVAYLYDQIVQTGTHEPIIGMGMKLMIPFEEVGAAVTNTMAWGYLKEPKRGRDYYMRGAGLSAELSGEWFLVAR